MAESRPVRLPPADLHRHVLPTAPMDLKGLRVHATGFPAIRFRLSANHRFSHPDAAAGLLYLGEDLETCLWECFGDAILDPGSIIAESDWNIRCASRIVATDLKICDLTDLATRRKLGVDLSALKHPNLAIPQVWGLAIQSHPDAADGLRFLSRFTGRRCFALFERPGLIGRLKEIQLSLLSDLDEAEDFLEANSITLV